MAKYQNTKRDLPTAEELAAQSLAADFDKLLLYEVKNCSVSLEDWLELNKPSEILREEGIGWIAVTKRNPEEDEDQNDNSVQNLPGLLKAWEELQNSKELISFETIRDLAVKYKVTTGKWLFHVETGYKIDLIWRRVATNLVNGILGETCSYAKVSPKTDFENCKHVICVYNDNYTNEDEVFAVEANLRKAGIKCQLNYKPDVYTHCGIYRRNIWNIRPTIYVSYYDAMKAKSNIKALHVLNEFE